MHDPSPNAAIPLEAANVVQVLLRNIGHGYDLVGMGRSMRAPPTVICRGRSGGVLCFTRLSGTASVRLQPKTAKVASADYSEYAVTIRMAYSRLDSTC